MFLHNTYTPLIRRAVSIDLTGVTSAVAKMHCGLVEPKPLSKVEEFSIYASVNQVAAWQQGLASEIVHGCRSTVAPVYHRTSHFMIWKISNCGVQSSYF